MLDSGDDLPSIPERSRLFHLEPMNIGKPNVESLASYTQRLIEAHSIDFDYFLQYEIYPNLGRQKKQFDYFSPESIINTGWMIEGSTHHYRLPEFGKLYLKRHRKATEKFIQVLEKLTLRTNLDRLTVMSLSDIAPTSGLLRRKLAWCPNCLSEWQRGGQSVYYPLLWSMKDVVICPEHECLLRHVCPQCEQSQPLLLSKVKAGYCLICSSWLSSDFRDLFHYRVQKLELKSKLDQYLWIANSISSLLENTSKSEKYISKKNLRKYTAEIQKLKTSRYQLLKKTWKGEDIDLIGLLEICYLTDTNLNEFLIEKY